MKQLMSAKAKRGVKRSIAHVYGSLGKRHGGPRVLLYHSIGAGPLAQPAKLFEEQMRFLRDHFDVVDARQPAGALPSTEDSVLITFDDGYLDNVEVVAPILLKLGLTAAFFPVTGLLHGDYLISRAREFSLYEDTPLMTWDHVRELHRAGMTIGSHTHFHADFAKSSEARTERQIRLSAEAISRELGLGRVLFAYPFGQVPQLTSSSRRVLRQVGVDTAFATIWGPVTERSDPLAVPRLRIDPDDTLSDFRSKLEGEWDFIRWVHGPSPRT